VGKPQATAGAASQASAPFPILPLVTGGLVPMKFAPTCVMRAHRFKGRLLLGVDMRPINVTLDSQTWELAKQKQNFSQWVRLQLRLNDNPKSLQYQLNEALRAIRAYMKLQDEQWAQEAEE